MIIRYLGICCCIFAPGFVIKEMTRKQIRKQKTNIMKTRIVLLALLALVSILTSCEKDHLGIVPSNNITSVEKSIARNSKLKVSSLFQVHIRFTDTEEKLIVEANENLHQYIQIEDKNGWLKIKFKNNVSLLSGHTVLNIYISTNHINEYLVDGAASVVLENELYADVINIDLEGASHFSGTLHSNKLYTDLSGASKIDINGYTTLLDVVANGASVIRSYDLESNQLNADLNGASEVQVTVMEKLSVKANGASTVFYKGNGVVHNQNLDGGSIIKKMD